jgi:hypothetical protein
MTITASPKTTLRTWTSIAIFAAAAGVLASLWGYRYASGNQVEQLPVVLRAMDPTYLTNDFFVNASAGYSPRTQFAEFVAFFTRFASLPHVYLALTILANVGIALATAVVALELFDHSPAAALLSMMAVMSAKTFWLGYSNVIYRNFLEPEHLAMPFVLLAVWAALRRKPILAALLTGIGAIFQSLVGLETGALLFGVMILFEGSNHFFPKRFPERSGWKPLLIGSGIFAAFTAAILLPYLGIKHLSDSSFIYILAYFRHPHHYLPSSFEGWQWLQAAAFLSAVAIAWVCARPLAAGFRRSTPMLLTLVAALFLACIGGYLFVEVWPSRLWTTAQVFRMLYLMKWLGLIILSGWAALLLPERARFGKRTQIRLDLRPFILIVGLMSAPAAAAAALYTGIRSTARAQRCPAFLRHLADLLVLGALMALVTRFDPDAGLTFLLTSELLMVLVLFYLPGWIAKPAVAAFASALVFILFQGDTYLSYSITQHINMPWVNLPDIGPEELDMARYITGHTTPNSTLLVNPSMGIYRTVAQRAIVVDFTAFPFSDSDMAEWLQRIYDVYGVPTSTGFDAVPELRENYTHITDEHLAWLANKYDVNYAVLYRSTPTQYVALYETTNYKLVRLKKPSR